VDVHVVNARLFGNKKSDGGVDDGLLDNGSKCFGEVNVVVVFKDTNH